MDITARLYPQAGDGPGCNVLGQFLPATNLLVGIATITLTVIQRLRLYIEKIMFLHFYGLVQYYNHNFHLVIIILLHYFFSLTRN